MGFVGQHAAHILKWQSSPGPRVLQQCLSRIALSLRSLRILLVALAVVPAITRPRFVRQSTRLALTDIFTVDHNMFGIARRTIGDTKVVITIVGGKIVYEADAK